MSVLWDRSDPDASLDTGYSHGLSWQFAGEDASGTFAATMVGREYRIDPLDGFSYGLFNDAFEVGGEAKGWRIRFGFAPDSVGSTIYSHADGPTPAAYIEFVFDPQTDVTLEDLSLDLAIGVTDNTSLNLGPAWAATSLSGYANAVAPDVSRIHDDPSAGQAIDLVHFDFGEEIYEGTDPLTIRVYGLIGEDEGILADRIAFTGEEIARLPEPTAAWLALVGVLPFALRRRR
ncbi:MAG: hypothetical protein R3F11_30295 [Verrucomicrobiales bacterium]